MKTMVGSPATVKVEQRDAKAVFVGDFAAHLIRNLGTRC